ncbi:MULTISPECIES: hypothetical protein [unclassified Burkholderia]|uniref:hypothetical protein n=1 Tax=unclassified Burkholderia TaxID=2613784 RepID=UPI002AB23350|nr:MULTISPECIES: hypothetical protein [unclassified Burkholderia]
MSASLTPRAREERRESLDRRAVSAMRSDNTRFCSNTTKKTTTHRCPRSSAARKHAYRHRFASARDASLMNHATTAQLQRNDPAARDFYSV